MIPNAVNIIADIAAILLTVVLVIRAFPLIKSGSNPMTVALFLFAMVSFMLSLAYWLAYSLMRPEARMPIAANEVGEIAMFLLLASSLDTVFRENRIPAIKERVLASAFVAASVALWIGWSGEWIQDIVYGIAFGYYLCVCVRALKQTTALDRTAWCILWGFCGTIILGQAGTFFVSEGLKRSLDLFCYGLMFVALTWLITKSFLAVKPTKDTKAALALSFTAHAFSLSTLYMSSGWFYMAAFAFSLATLPLMLHTLKREVTA